MATQGTEILDIGHLEAAADLSAKQFYAVKQTTSTALNLCSAVTDRGLGILQDKPKSGEAGKVRRLGISKAITDGSGTAISVGDQLGPNASGKLVKVTTADRPVLAEALEASSTDGAIISVLMKPDSVYRTPA
jgi:hypothetical protein